MHVQVLSGLAGDFARSSSLAAFEGCMKFSVACVLLLLALVAHSVV
jgi:hypothetical protein